MLLLFVVAVIGTVHPVVAAAASGHHHPPLLDCGPAPILSRNADSIFRANLATVLAALPSAAAARKDGFATVHFGGAGPGRVFARGACFGANVSSSPGTVGACKACLSAAARDVTGGCRSSGRAVVWRNEFFLSYADSNASSSREDAFRGWFYAGPTAKATLADGGACVTDRAVDCDQCWQDSARVATVLGWWQRIHGEEVIVVGYHCFLGVRVSSLPEGPNYASFGAFIFSFWAGLMLAIAAVLLCCMFFDIIKIVRALPQANNNG